MEGPLRKTDIDRLVLEYLRKRNFKEAEKVLELEMKESIPAGELLVQSWLGWGGEGVEERLLFATAGEGDPAELVQAFDRLAAWVDNSLDIYNPELSRVLFPAFAHTYLNLINIGAMPEAQQLMGAHRQRFLDAAVGGSNLRMQELQDLASISSAEAAAASRTASALRSRRLSIRLCRASYDLLTQFLQGPKQLVMLGIVNEHIKFEARMLAGEPAAAGSTLAAFPRLLLLLVVEGRPATLADLAGVEEDLTAGAMQADVVATNQFPLQLRLLQARACLFRAAAASAGMGLQQGRQAEEEADAASSPAIWGSVEDKWAQQQAEKAEDEAQKQAEAEALTKKKRIALQRAAAEARSKRENIGLDRVAPKFPLPPISDEQEGMLMQELQLRQQVSADSLPSCCFFTFFNTHQSLNCVAFSSDAAAVAGGFADSSVRLYDLQARASGAAAGAAPADWVTYFAGHSGPVFGLDFSPDNQLLFSASGDGSVRLWSMEVRANLAVYKGHQLPVWDVATCPYFSPFYFASCGADRTARLWSTDRVQPLRLFVGHTSDVDVVRWHPNCHYIATGSADRTVRLWDVRTGQCCRLLVGHKDKISALAFSPDGTTLATADASGTLIVWDLATAKRLTTAHEHRGPVWSLAYSQGEGALLASGGADNTVRLWNAKPAAATVGAAAAGRPAAGAARGAAAAAAAAGGGTAEQQGAAAGSQQEGGGGGSEPYAPVVTWRTKLTPVYGLRFTTRNLLLGSGALTIPSRK
ncbi:hypothetical protein CHLNCDRAFT_133982 [Chlorella variabilis]|uniref:TFIID subunit TAF5 NTD2 domain-containing protein n=1 Tax=Chlorella variabilis TaxID=554065 RepID=E1ZEQ5_CHLVA|nr:hypothetical protein CHLNCDRAFT_133982 [Chlorella variabilis]EFN55699.1 hypothetical protein CHLNCDRAFT_133982 [Chlorella variabilis]|eukprot:XP_005847801.1 hypothetical protein CHLNCDRAFT_133982 [Chlorella variabilis]